MHLLPYYCVQVLVLLVCQLELSYSVPLRPPSHFDLLIDPLHQSEPEEVESKRTVKSVLNVPYITPPHAVPSCPPGQTRLSGGPCVQKVVSSGISDDQTLVLQLTRQYFTSNKRKQPPKRHRHPTTTMRTTTLGKSESVPTTEVVTESSVTPKDLPSPTTTAWSTASPTLTSTPKSQQEQAFTEEIMTTIPTTLVDKDATTEQVVVEPTSLLNDLPSTETEALFLHAEELLSQTTETEPYSINDKTTINYGMDATELPSKISDEFATFITSTTELPMENHTEPIQLEKSEEQITELPKEEKESEKELKVEIATTAASTTTTNTTSTKNETVRDITEQPAVVTTLSSVLPSLNHSSDTDVIVSETSDPTEKVNPAVETSSPFALETITEIPEESETVREEITTIPEGLISTEDISSRTELAPVAETVEEFTTAIYLSQPEESISPVPYQPEMIFDFVPSPSDIYKPTMPPKYTRSPKMSFPLEFSSSSRSGRLDDDSQSRHSSFVSYDYFLGPQGLPRSNNFNPAYTFS